MGREIFVRKTEMIEGMNETSTVLGTLSDMNTTAGWYNYRVERNYESTSFSSENS